MIGRIGVGGLAALLAVAAFGASGAVSGAAAPAGHQGFRDYNVPGAVTTELVGINDRGMVCGKYWDTAGVGHVFIAAGSVITTWNVPGVSGWTSISGCNDVGDVAGAYEDASGVYHGYLRTATGHFTYINDPQAGAMPNEDQGTVPESLNDNGVVGQYEDSQGVMHGFVYHNGRYTTVYIPGAMATGVWAENDLGVMIGSYYDSVGAARGFIDFHGIIIPFNPPGAGDVAGAGTYASGISMNGVVVGTYYTASAPTLSEGFIFKDGKFTALSDPEAGDGANEGTSPSAIAEDGSAIIGEYWDSVGNTHSFILDL
jgi:hypothetical protein